MKRCFRCICVFYLIAIGGCGKTLSTDEHRKALVEANNTFTFELYRAIGSKGNVSAVDNMFCSPLSVSSVLAIPYLGARGTTAAQLENVLHFDSIRADAHPAFHDILQAMRGGEAGRKYTLYLANRMWLDTSIDLRDAFVRDQQRYYASAVEHVPFASSPTRATTTIDAWARRETNGRIDGISDGGSTKGTLTRMLLTSVIYFKGRWKYEFNPDATDDEEFHLLTGENATVSMMHQAGRFKYAFLDGCKLLEMPYTGEEVSMTLILPNGSLPDFEEGLTWKTVANWMDKMEVTKDVDVKIPRFRMQTRMPLTEVLQAMGLTDVFINPDFSAMTGGTAGPPISAIDQEGYIDVNEEGTEAYVVTRGSWFIRSGKETPVFHADHPFVFLIRDLRTGSILFIGRFVDPRHQAEAES